MLKTRIDKSEGTGSLVLEGELIIDHAEELRQSLVDALDSEGSLNLNIEGVSKVDLFGLQVLCSAHRSALQSSRELALIGKQPEAFRNALQQSSFGCYAGCSADNICPWNGK